MKTAAESKQVKAVIDQAFEAINAGNLELAQYADGAMINSNGG